MGHITEKSEYAAKLAATGGSWPHHFTVVTAVDKDGVPIEAAQPTYTEIDEEDNSAGGAPVVWAYPAGVYRALNGQELQLSFGATNGGLTVGVANVTVNFYQLDDGAYFLLDTVVIANPAVVAGSMVKVRVKCEDATGATIAGATHFTVTGNISVDAACHAYFGYDLFRADMDVELEASDIEIGAVEIKNGTTDQRATVNASGELLVKDTTADTLLGTIDSDTSGIATGIGAVTDAPVADNTTVEDATARSEISLLKRVANLLIALLQQAYISATNHLRTAEISPLDTRDVAITTNASNQAIAAATVCFPANAATPTSCWDTQTLNANGGKARRMSFNGKVYCPNTKTAIIKMYVSDDPNATSSSKNWVQKFFRDNDGTLVLSKTLTGSGAGTTEVFAIETTYPLTSRYVYISVTGDDAGVNACYIYGSAGW